MDLRLALHELAREHRLDTRATRELHRLAGLDDPPSGLERRLSLGVAVLAAALAGLGAVFWIAANWSELGRYGRFALLQALVLAACIGAVARPAARAPLSLLTLLAIGALFAWFGQTYQTGADPWQLFALWALLALPLAMGARSDVVWAPWAIVASSAIALWVQAHTGHQWRVEPQDALVHAAGWAAAALVVAALGTPLQRWTGAGQWSRRTAATLFVVMVVASGIGALFGSRVAAQYGVALLVLGSVAALHARRALFDIYTLSAAAFGLNVLLVGGLVRLLVDSGEREPVGALFVVGLAAAALLAATVSIVLRVARAQGE
jgi:uncharacterized membrane protein